MRTRFLLLFFCCISISSLSSFCFAQQANDNSIILGENYQKNQQSELELKFSVPDGWTEDRDSATEFGLYKVFVPNGSKLANARKAITIAFQKKAQTPGLEDLQSFVRLDVQNTLSRFPDMQASRWQPSQLDPERINFWSLEIYGKKKDQPSPHHLLVLDSGDGYYSVVLTAEDRKELNKPAYDAFFNSLSLSPRK